MFNKEYIYNPPETKMEEEESQELEVFEDVNENEAIAFLNLAVDFFSPNILLVAMHKAEEAAIIKMGRNPLSVATRYYQGSHVHDAAKNEPQEFIICTVENKKIYSNAITFNDKNGRWVISRKELDYQLEKNPSSLIITPNKLLVVYNSLLLMLDSVITHKEHKLRHISISHIESISKLADYFKSDTKQSTEQHKKIYECIIKLFKLQEESYLISTNEQSRYDKLKEKSYLILASYYNTEGYKENQINDAMFETAYIYLRNLVTLSTDHGEAVRLATRMFLLLQGQAVGMKTTLADTQVLGNDVIRDLLMNTSYPVFKSIAKGMGTQYQKGFNDGRMFAQSKEGLQNTGMFSFIPRKEESASSFSHKYGSGPESDD